MKQTIEINVPEGYEVAEGTQPRPAKTGEYFLSSSSDGYSQAREDLLSSYIILRKKEPQYYATEIKSGFSNQFMKVVEIKALDDALKMLEARTFQFTKAEYEIYSQLKELVKK